MYTLVSGTLRSYLIIPYSFALGNVTCILRTDEVVYESGKSWIVVLLINPETYTLWCHTFHLLSAYYVGCCLCKIITANRTPLIILVHFYTLIWTSYVTGCSLSFGSAIEFNAFIIWTLIIKICICEIIKTFFIAINTLKILILKFISCRAHWKYHFRWFDICFIEN